MDLNNLTHKNQEFMHIATKQLIQDGKSDAEIKAILADILPSIEENQKNGIPARTFLGAPTVWAAQFSKQQTQDAAAAKEAKNTNPWLMWMDASLFWLGFLGLITGVMALVDSRNQTYGLLSMVVIGLGGGAFLYATYYFIYRHVGKERAQRPKLLKTIGLLTLLMIAWLLLFTATSYLPAVINPTLSPISLLIIGALAFALRYYFKKKYNVLSPLAAQSNQRR